MKRIIFCLVLSISLLFLEGCQLRNPLSNQFSSDYLPGYDYQMNMDMSTGSGLVMAQAADGYYLTNGSHLYYMDKTKLEPVILCNRPNCLHELAEESQKNECSAYYQYGIERIYYYDEALYLPISVERDGRIVYCLRKLAKDGTFLEDIYTFPGFPQSFCIHRGYAYYAYADYGENKQSQGGDVASAYRVMQISLQDKSERLIYTNDLAHPGIFWISAKGKNLYFYNNGYVGDPSKGANPADRVLQYVCYDLQNNTFTVTDMNPADGEAGKPAILDDTITYCKYNYSYTDPRNRDLYQRSLNGENEKKVFTIEPTGCTIQWDGTYYYVDNYVIILGQPENASLLRQIWVYDKDFNLINTIDFSNVDGEDLSQSAMSPIFISDDFIFTSKNAEERVISSFIYIDKSELASGKVSPHKVTF